MGKDVVRFWARSTPQRGSPTVLAELAMHAGRAPALPRRWVAGAAVPALANAGTASAVRPEGASCGQSREDEWAKTSFSSARNEVPRDVSKFSPALPTLHAMREAEKHRL